MGRKDTSFGVKYQNILVTRHLLNYEDISVGTPIYIKVCCDIYRPFYIYAFHWIIFSYKTFFISWVFLLLLTYIYTLHVYGISLTRFNYFSKFFPCSFVDLSVKGTNNFWKLCGLVDGFNKFRRQIPSGVEKLNMSRWVPYNFVPPLKYIYRTTPIF